MPKVKVYLKCLDEVEKRALLALLKEAGFEVIEDEDDLALVPDQAEIEEVKPEEVLIVLINDACASDVELEKATQQAVSSRRRVIGVWPKNKSHGKVPAALEKYGADVVTWNSGKLRKAVAEEVPAQWETTTGVPRAEPRTPRNRC
jgi:hypothetical protein